MRKRAALDLDGVTYAWDKTARYLLKRQGASDMDRPATYWYDLRDRVGAELWSWLWDDGVRLGLFRHGHLIKGAIDGIRRLREIVDIVVVTHRPKTAVRDTLAFLSYHFGAEDPYPFSDVHILTQEEPKTLIPWDVIVDDKPENALAALDIGRHVVLFNQPWNQSFDSRASGWRRAFSWQEVPDLVEELLT